MRLILFAHGAILTFAAPGDAVEKSITILTGSPNGVYYPLGTALADVDSKGIAGADVRHNLR